MRILSILIIILQCHILSAQCGNRYNTAIFPNISTTSYEFGQNTTYSGANQKLSLDLYTPNGDTFKNRPCVVFCFGGAFVQGTRTSPELVFFATNLAQRGFVCASIDYRLDNAVNLAANGENGSVIRAVQDAKAAIRYLKSKTADFGIDSNMIFIGGTSAGGITALTMGFSQFDEFKDSVKTIINSLGGWEGTTNTLSQSSKVKGLFNFAGAVLDTNHIVLNDLPVYLNHANGDATVPFRSGYPLNGQSKTFVHGSFNIAQRMKNKGNFYMLDSFNSADHPAFSSSDFLIALTTLNLTSENLRKFLFKVMKCDQGSSSVLSSNSQKWTIENPVTNYIKLIDGMDPKEFNIYNIMGQRIELKEISSQGFNVSHLPRGIYILNFQTTSQKIVLE